MKINTKICLIALLASSNAHAELPNLFNLARDLVTGQSSRQTGAQDSPNFGSDITGSGPSTNGGSSDSVRYLSKQQLLEDARKGGLAEYWRIQNYGQSISKQLVYAVGLILDREYGTPIPNWDNKSRFAGGGSQPSCDNTMLKQDIHTLVQVITKNRISLLSNRPPDFKGTPDPEDSNYINDMFRRINGECRMSGNQTAPFVKSLGQLMTDYAKASDEYVAEQRDAFSQQYLQANAKKKLDDQQRAASLAQQETTRKALEQSQIDADRRRIEEKERKAKEQDKNRVAG